MIVYEVICSYGDEEKIVGVLNSISSGNAHFLPYKVCIIGGICTGKTTLWKILMPEYENYEIDDEHAYELGLNVFTTNRFPVAIGNEDVLVRVFRNKDDIKACVLNERNALQNAVVGVLSGLHIVDTVYIDPDRLERKIIEYNKPAAIIHLVRKET